MNPPIELPDISITQNVFLNIPELLKYVLYINLDSRPDRLAHVQKEMDKMEIVGERMNAVKMKNGAIGCTLSHIKCLELAKERQWPHVFICEDDILFLNPDLLKTNIEKFSSANPKIHWDVLIIGGNNCTPYKRVDNYCIQVFNNQTTTGYIVQSHYYDTLIANFKESATLLLKEPHNRQAYALDIYWKRLQQRDNWFMITPPTVIQVEDYSDIEGRKVNYGKLMLDLDKEWLFRKQYMNILR